MLLEECWITLSIKVTSGFHEGNLEGRSLVVSHLLFADDMLILCDADLDQILILCIVLIWFEVVSGLKINLG